MRALRGSAWVLPLLAFGALILFGVIGLARREGHAFDLRVLYGAGAWYLEGVSPYGEPRTPPQLEVLNLEMWIYAYPPHFSPFLMALASISFDSALLCMTVLNLFLALAMAKLITLLMQAVTLHPLSRLYSTAVAAIIIGNPFTAHAVWLGNPVLIVATALSAVWWLLLRNRPILAGVLLAVSTLKPQFALLPIFWLIAEKKWATLLTAALTCLALVSIHIVQFGALESFQLWFEGLETYEWVVEHVQADANRRRMGFEMYFEHLALDTRLLLPAALSATAALWKVRARLNRLDTLSLLSVFAVLLLPSHNYDLVFLAPLAGALAVAAQGKPAVLAAIALGGILLCLPQRYVLLLDVEPLTYWRTPMVTLLLLALLLLKYRRSAV